MNRPQYILRTLSLLIIVTLLSGAVSAGQTNSSSSTENPFLELVGKPYAEYHDTYMHVVGSLLHTDSLSRVRLVTLFDEAAAADKSGEWKLIDEMVRNTVRFYNSRRGGYTWSKEYTAEDYSDKMLALAERAGKQGFPLVRIFGLYQAAEGYRVFVENYEKAFSCYLDAAAELDSVTTKVFPPRPHIYNYLANLYYDFREYEDALKYYRKVAADPDVPGNYYGSLNPAINGMALSYRNGYKDYERSDSCFMRLLELTRPSELDRMVWEGITEANIGCNYYLRQQPDMALKWLVPALGKITRPNDFDFVSQRAVDVAEIYLEKGNPPAARKYLDMALDYHTRTRLPEKNSRMYDALTRYYTAIGNSKAASAYLDSTLATKDKEAKAFSGLVLRRVEQQLRAADQKIYHQQMEVEHAHARMYLLTAVTMAMVLIVVLVLLGLTQYYYRRTRAAYHELVRRSQQWAGLEVPAEKTIPYDEEEEMMTAEGCAPAADRCTTADAGCLTPPPEPPADEHDGMVMAEIEKAMNEQKLYKRADLTLDALAEATGFNRYFLSGVLNRHTGNNVNAYINEFRVKEVVRILSEPANDHCTMDEIAFEAGFNDRQSLYRVFKKIIGLSPGAFRRNRDIDG